MKNYVKQSYKDDFSKLPQFLLNLILVLSIATPAYAQRFWWASSSTSSWQG